MRCIVYHLFPLDNEDECLSQYLHNLSNTQDSIRNFLQRGGQTEVLKQHELQLEFSHRSLPLCVVRLSKKKRLFYTAHTSLSGQTPVRGLVL